LYWTEKADDYSARYRAAASINDNWARSPGESGIMAYFPLQRYLGGNLPPPPPAF
jgi:hypothetical protein